MVSGARIASAGASRYPAFMVSKRWTWLTGLAVLFAGLTNAHSHVHYCFDGQRETAAHPVDLLSHAHELPAAHGHDSSHDDRHGASAEHRGAVSDTVSHDDADHDDLDLDVPNDALAKSLKYDLPAIVAAIAWKTEPQPSLGAMPVSGPEIAPAPDPRYTRPPLRAPPR
jgi:hypothetical protein